MKGQKKALPHCDINCVNIPVNRVTTKSRLCGMIEDDLVLMQYFPDNPYMNCDRQYILDVVNTLDSTFFERAWQDVDKDLIRAKEEKEQVIPIVPEMHAMISKSSNMCPNLGSTTKVPRMQLKKVKRKRPTIPPAPELSTKIKVDWKCQ